MTHQGPLGRKFDEELFAEELFVDNFLTDESTFGRQKEFTAAARIIDMGNGYYVHVLAPKNVTFDQLEAAGYKKQKVSSSFDAPYLIRAYYKKNDRGVLTIITAPKTTSYSFTFEEMRMVLKKVALKKEEASKGTKLQSKQNVDGTIVSYFDVNPILFPKEVVSIPGTQLATYGSLSRPSSGPKLGC